MLIGVSFFQQGSMSSSSSSHQNRLKAYSSQWNEAHSSVGTQDIYPVLILRVNVELFSMLFNWYIAEGKEERQGAVPKTLFLVPFLWALVRQSECSLEHSAWKYPAWGRPAQSHLRVGKCSLTNVWNYFSLLVPWKSAPTFSGNSTREKVRQYLSAWKPLRPLIMNCWICWIQWVSVNESTLAVLPGKGEQLWEPRVSLVVVQKSSALCLFGSCVYNTVNLSWRNFWEVHSELQV